MGEITDEPLIAASTVSAWLGADVEHVTWSRIGDGLVGMNLRLELTYGAGSTGPRSVVVKLPSLDPTSRATGIALRNYEREVKFYGEIADTVDIRVPHCYHGEWHEATGDFVLVLEDLTPARQGDQLTGCTPALAQLAVAELARLHGPRWDDPTLHDVDWLQRRTPETAAQLVGIYSMMLPGFLGTYGPQLDTEGVELVQGFLSRLPDYIEGDSGPLAVTHGDYRLDNLMFGTEAGGPPVAAVDWQTPGHGTPLADVSYFVGAGLLTDDRRVHERELVELYVHGLAEQGVTVDADWAWQQYRRAAFAGIIMSVVASQIVQVTDRSVPMFTAMATRHVRHALDLDSLAAI